MRFSPAFTLVELIIVMALLALVAMLTLPSLARSVRGRALKDEAARFLAATEYGRDEAVSQGVPMIVWIDPQTQHFGVEAKAGFEGAAAREREFAINPDLHFQIDKSGARGSHADAVEFAPDGTPATTSIDTVRLADQSGDAITIVKTRDGWSYEIQKEEK